MDVLKGEMLVLVLGNLGVGWVVAVAGDLLRRLARGRVRAWDRVFGLRKGGCGDRVFVVRLRLCWRRGR